MTNEPLIGVFVFGGAAILYGSIVLTLDWFGRRRQHRRR